MALTTLFPLLLLATAICADLAPHKPLRELKKVSGEKSGRYIVTLNKGVNKADVTSVLKTNVTNDWDIIHGFAVDGSMETLDELLSHPDVESVEEDGMVYAYSFITQTDAPWGIARLNGPLSDTDPLGYYPYTYDSSAGEGVDIYVVDTGIYIGHDDFEGRAIWGANFAGGSDTDGNGHGTHCAGTMVGKTYGVAKKARVIAIKVLTDNGSGFISGVISGLNYARTSANTSNNPSVVNISLGGPANFALDNAVTSITNSGIHAVVAAPVSGNAANSSPAGVPSAITVGATNIHDARFAGSYGSVIDIWAPGVQIRSAAITSPTAFSYHSGTSMAAAHVSGLVAYLMGLLENPSEGLALLHDYAEPGVISGIPSGTVNLLANNGA